MEMNISSSQQILSEGSQELQNVLSNASAEAKEAIQQAKASLTGEDGTPPSTQSSASLSTDTKPFMEEKSSKERIQIIDEDKVFSKELTPAISRWGLVNKGFGYDVVSVFGSQSTGKSTLLNRLFGTTFDVMDEKARKQTTKGIWMCKAKDGPIMVMDVEGTDGRERGEDQDFERKSALFSLASSEVLLINLWEHQVGLYQGANMGLLKTVFEVNLGLFGTSRGSGKEKTLLMFVIRDHVGSTPLLNLEATLRQDMEKIWHSLSKPEALESSLLTDYFDLAFTTLPHKVLMPTQFEEAVSDLRGRFLDQSREDYVFKPIYHKRIPADGVAFYMEGIWDQVQSNADLDIPTQQELLAQFRCDEIAAVATEAFLSSVKTIRRQVESGNVVDGLGLLMSSWKQAALAHFDRDASRYHVGVYQRKRIDLIQSLDSSLSPLFLGHVKNLHKVVVRDFKQGIEEALKGKEYDFGAVVQTSRERAENTFREGAEEVRLDDTDWQYDDEFALLKEDITLIGDQCRFDETKRMVNSIERNIKKQLAEPIEFLLNKPTPQMWDKILSQFSETLERAESTYLTKAKSFNCTSSENTASLSTLRRRAWQALRSKVDEQTSETVLLSKLRVAFEERFRYDAAGVPRVWKPEDDIDDAFKKAKEETLVLLPLYARILPTAPSLLPSNISSDSPASSLSDPDAEFDFENSLSILTPTKEADLETKFRREADALYVEAKRSMVVSRAMIPVWVWGALCFLGFNEFMAVITNPLYFSTLLILIVSAYFVHKFGLSGPLVQVVTAVYKEVQRLGVEKMKEIFSEDAHSASRPGAHNQTASVKKRREPILVPAVENAEGLKSGPDGAYLEK
ncbi:root hair defective 3 gtp-binding protein [Phaffia rhodozyma]|uniref:Root hair defective 3 gtp-binding protein n=1 Tax=Phaffia rhodozyma TaxID=264483 RepID=A0A0F7SXY3_PHARH|nr:root hair defective 3 gtp-binding protein [Phaffia rhodozyma]